ncbi:putative permease [Rhodoferax antarcticus]|uniref:Auxin Efflux Carrier n=1 Tax=Rhodoferax antarcticus ANT.BR TaxID=1111071 RepID=A0A1Q8YE16_9BURK|nr:putative permease [Rhodoferax antarcticus]OLP06253.1 auxin Efflux Carrier [Rhodoferax antarcticus ANT.BR]
MPTSFFPDFSLILIGYLVCRFTPLNRPVWTQVEQLVYFFLFFSAAVSVDSEKPAGHRCGQSSGGRRLGGIALAYSVPHWPGFKGIGAASLALGLMATGAGMQLGALNHAKLLGVALLTIKHLLMALLALGLTQLFGLNPVQTTILLMFSALPTKSSCYVLAARMGYDGAYVAALVTLSTLLGMLSLPLALGVLRSRPAA